MPAFAHPLNPLASEIGLSTRFAKNGASTVDQQGAQISVTALADPEQPSLPAAGSLFGNKPQPRGELATIFEAGPVTDCRNQRGCRDRPDTFYLADALTHRVSAKEMSDPSVVGRDALIKFGEFLMHVEYQIPDHFTQARIHSFRDLAKSASQARDITTDHNTMLGQKTSDLVHQPGPAGHQPLTNAMH